MKKAKLGLFGFLSLPFLLANAPAPGPSCVSVAIEAVTVDGVTTVTNKSKDRYVSSLYYEDGKNTHEDDLFPKEYYLEDTAHFLAPGESYVPSFELGEGETLNPKNIKALGYTNEQVIFLDEEIEAPLSEDDGEWKLHIQGNFANPSTEETLYRVGVYYEEEGLITAYMVDVTIYPYENEDVDSYLTFDLNPGQHEYKKILVYDNEYYSARWPGRDDSPLAIVAYVFLGLLGAAVIGAGVYLIIKQSKEGGGF